MKKESGACFVGRSLFVRLTFSFLAIMMQDNIIIFNSEINLR